MTKKFVYQTNKVRLDFMDKFCHFLIAPQDVVLNDWIWVSESGGRGLDMSVGGRVWGPVTGYTKVASISLFS